MAASVYLTECFPERIWRMRLQECKEAKQAVPAREGSASDNSQQNTGSDG